MSLKYAISRHMLKITTRFGGRYQFTWAGQSKFNIDRSYTATLEVQGILIAQGGNPIPSIHALGSTGKTTAYRLYTTDATAAQLSTDYSIHVDDNHLYAVESIRQPLPTIGVWVVSLSA